ncbi:MAG: hypothetical protein K5681_06570 [Treponema sp.]|nr:hypothetical protein [Treponema sp.]
MKTDLAFLDDEMQESPATAHLCLYMAEKRGFQEYCAHMPDDDNTLLTRLDFISTFDGGDQQILDAHKYHCKKPCLPYSCGKEIFPAPFSSQNIFRES